MSILDLLIPTQAGEWTERIIGCPDGIVRVMVQDQQVIAVGLFNDQEAGLIISPDATHAEREYSIDHYARFVAKRRKEGLLGGIKQKIYRRVEQL